MDLKILEIASHTENKKELSSDFIHILLLNFVPVYIRVFFVFLTIYTISALDKNKNYLLGSCSGRSYSIKFIPEPESLSENTPDSASH